jgi:ABC-type transport system substrate-binding protein
VAVRHRGGLIGSGPFILRSKGSSGLRLAANKQHFAGRPFIDTLWFKTFPKASAERLAFQVGKLHLSLHGTSTFTSQPQQTFTEVHSPIMTATVFLGVGRSKPYLSDPQFRLALLKGIDRKRLGRVAVTGTSRVAVHPSPLGRRRGLKVVAFDRKGANRLLAAMADRHRQLRQDAGSGRLKLSLLVDASRFEDHDVASQVVADLDLIGISTSIDARPAKEYARRLASGRYQLVIVRYPVQVPIGNVSLASVLNAAGQRAAAIRCLAARRCGRAESRTFIKRLPMIPLVHTSTRVAFDARIGGARITRIGLIPYADLFWTRGAP